MEVILAMRKRAGLSFMQLIGDLFLSEPSLGLSLHLISGGDRDRSYFRINEVRIYLPHKRYIL